MSPIAAFPVERVQAFRLARHHLSRRAAACELAKTVSRIGGLHAQLMSAAELAAGARVDGISPTVVRRALLEERTLVKTWAMRGTLHLLAADDLAVYSAAIQPRQPRDWQRLALVIGDSVDSEPKTRREIAEAAAPALPERFRDHLRSGWGWLFKPAAWAGALCFGPPRGNEVTFVRPEAWIGRPLPRPDPEEAMLEMVRRYLRFAAPAGPTDFARWLGQHVRYARAAFAELGGELAEVVVDGRKAWVLAHDLDAIEGAEPEEVVRLLPHFDTFNLLHLDRSHLVDRQFQERVWLPSGCIAPTVQVNGRIEGTWKLVKTGRSVDVETEPFEGHLPDLSSEVERLRRFLSTS